MRFLVLFYFYFLSSAWYYQVLGTNTAWSVSYGKEKTPWATFSPPWRQGKGINPNLSRTRPTAHLPRKMRNQTPIEGME